MPLTSTWLAVTVIYTGVYTIFLWSYWGIADDWVYNVLDWRDAGNLIYYIILPLLVVAAFWIMCASASLSSLPSVACVPLPAFEALRPPRLTEWCLTFGLPCADSD